MTITKEGEGNKEQVDSIINNLTQDKVIFTFLSFPYSIPFVNSERVMQNLVDNGSIIN